MSDYEAHRGTLTKVQKTKEEVVQEFLDNYKGKNKEILKAKNNLLSKDDLDELFQDYLEDSYIELDSNIYKVKNIVIDDEMLIMDKNPDGTLSYIVKFYNGGCGFNEALEAAYERIKK